MGFVKKIMEIGSETNSIATEDVFDISGEFDIDNICGTLSFGLPYYINLPDSKKLQYNPAPTGKGLNTNKLKKYDTVKLYYREYDTDPGNIIAKDKTNGVYIAGGKQLIKIFDGFIDQIKLSKSKESIDYSFTALGTLGLANYRNLQYEHKEGDCETLILTWLQIAGLQKGSFNVSPVLRDLIPIRQMRFVDVDAQNFFMACEGGVSLKDALESVRKKYALIIHQSGDGYVNVMFPFFMVSNPYGMKTSAWTFDINNGTLFEIDYGDLTQNYNAVIVLGVPPVYGTAIDVVGVQNNNGKVNYKIEENRNLAGSEDCQSTARNILLDICKNYFITIKTKYAPDMMVGQPAIIIDNDKYDGTQVFYVKSYSFTISKEDVSCSVQLFANGINFTPEDVLLAPDGALDTDVLNIANKEVDVTPWTNL